VRLEVTLVAVIAVIAALAAAGAVAATAPTYDVAFNGNGTEHQVDLKLQIEDTGDCEAAEHVDVTATLAWSASWTGFRPGGRSGRAAAAVKGSRFAGTDVKDACEPGDEAPPGWDSEASCETALATSAAPQLATSVRGQRLVLTLAAPSFEVPDGTKCPLVVRNDQLTAHAAVQLSKLHALKQGKAITVPVGTGSPGPGDLYAPVRDCSEPTKPYDGYRTEDHCSGRLTWRGTVTVTRAS
jgi:hypothetical protein